MRATRLESGLSGKLRSESKMPVRRPRAPGCIKEFIEESGLRQGTLKSVCVVAYYT
jgi:hypothetical protein